MKRLQDSQLYKNTNNKKIIISAEMYWFSGNFIKAVAKALSESC